MTEVILTALAWLGTYLVHSTLLLGAVALFARKRLQNQPRLLERTWKVAVLGGIVTASVQVAVVSDPFLGSLSVHSVVAQDTQTPDNAPFAPAEVVPTSAVPARPVQITSPVETVARPQLVPTDERVADTARRPRPSRTNGAGAEELPGFFPFTEEAPARREEVALTTPAPSRAAPTPPSPVARGERSRLSTPTARGQGRGTREEQSTLPLVTGILDASENDRALAPAPQAITKRVPKRTPKALPWKPAVLTTWLVVGGWGLFGFLFAWSRLFARLSDRRVLKSGLIVDQLDELCRRAGVKRRIRLTASSSIDSPITHGWIRREICVPERALIELSSRQLESTLAHELAHVLRRDPLWFGVLALVERVLFFQPLNRVARRQLQETAEILCDDWAVRWTGGRLALASALTEIAHWIVGRRQLALPSPGMASSRLGDRVERLLDDAVSRQLEPRRTWLPPTAIGALGLIVFAVPGVTSARPSTPAKAASDAVVGDETPPQLAYTFDPARIPAPPNDSSFGLETDQELFEVEMRLLQEELEALRAELDETQLYDQFEHAFETIEDRVEDLRSREERLTELLRLVLSETEDHPDETP